MDDKLIPIKEYVNLHLSGLAGTEQVERLIEAGYTYTGPISVSDSPVQSDNQSRMEFCATLDNMLGEQNWYAFYNYAFIHGFAENDTNCSVLRLMVSQ